METTVNPKKSYHRVIIGEFIYFSRGKFTIKPVKGSSDRIKVTCSKKVFVCMYFRNFSTEAIHATVFNKGCHVFTIEDVSDIGYGPLA